MKASNNFLKALKSIQLPLLTYNLISYQIDMSALAVNKFNPQIYENIHVCIKGIKTKLTHQGVHFEMKKKVAYNYHISS